jgi:hypothetical protein
MTRMFLRALLAATATGALSLPATAQQTGASGLDAGTMDPAALEAVHRPRPYSPYAGRNFPTRPLFGDTHLHTGMSMDAGAAGARLMPADAYRFAKGEEIMASSGQSVKLSRPLDFLVVADHSDNMGFFPKLLSGDAAALADPTGRRWYDLIQSGRGADAAMDIIQQFTAGTFPQALLSMPGAPAFKSAWEQTI